MGVMKASPKKLLPLTLIGIAVTSLFSVQPAQAFTITLEQMGANVVANGSGAINLSGLGSPSLYTPGSTGLWASNGFIETGAPPTFLDGYQGFTGGPTSFGSGGFNVANTFSGDFVGIWGEPTFYGAPTLWVPNGYVSGAALSDSMTFFNSTIASLGLTPGTYVWSWGDGRDQNFTLIIRGSVPDGGSTVCLLGCALLGVVSLRRRLGC